MNLFFFGIIIFIIIFFLLNWFAKANSKKITKYVKSLIFIVSILLAGILLIGGRLLFSLPLLVVALSVLKIKGLTAIQIFQLWRLLKYLRDSGKFAYYKNEKLNQSSNNLSLDEAYNILGLKKGASKKQVINAAHKLQKKIHPDTDLSLNTQRLSQIVNEAKEIILKRDFN